MPNEFRRAQDCVRRARIVVIVILMLIPVVFAVGRVTAPDAATVRAAESAPVPRELPDRVDRFHDPVAGATCWKAERNGAGVVAITCLPDQLLLGSNVGLDSQ